MALESKTTEQSDDVDTNKNNQTNESNHSTTNDTQITKDYVHETTDTKEIDQIKPNMTNGSLSNGESNMVEFDKSDNATQQESEMQFKGETTHLVLMMNGHGTSSEEDDIQSSSPGTGESSPEGGRTGRSSPIDSSDGSDKIPKLTTSEKKKSKRNSGSSNKEKNVNKNSDNKSEQDTFLLQDAGFTVKIVPPGTDSFEIQVSSMELVQEIHQLLMDREDTCHRTCFSLQLSSNTLDNFAELKNIEGLQEGSVIKVVEEPYTMREARIHVRHVRDLLKSLDSTDAYNGVDCSSLSFLNVVTQGDILEKKKNCPDSVDCTPPDFIMPGSKERPIIPLQPQIKEQKGPLCLKILTSSGWNPPPGTRKMHGDLMYLYVVTLEDKHFHITASTCGFFINQSTDEEFNPKPSNPNNLWHSLIELLNQISPGFKKNFSLLQKKRTQRHPFERVATPYQVYQWTAPALEHSIDAIRAEDASSSKLGYEEHIPGQTRDWNEELQTTRELPRKTLPERLLRERAIFKVHSDFVAAATRGAIAVIDGNVMAINPGEEAKMQMFIWNNIFFSLGFDVRSHYKELGGDAAAFVAPKNDLQGVKVYSAIDQEGLYTLGTVVIDYRGYRVTAQSIIPGILEREQEQSVVYGSVDFGKTVVTHPKYLELLSKAGQHLKILNHKVISENNEEVEICSSVECKGIIGNDSRHYILDLLRTFPPDVNFLKLPEIFRRDSKIQGFPVEHKHKLCCLRQELIDAFVEARYMAFIKYAACNLQQLSLKKQFKEIEKSGEDTNVEIVNGYNSEKETDLNGHICNGHDKEVENNEDSKEDEKEKVIEVNDASKTIETNVAKSIVESITDGKKKEMEESSKEIVRKACVAVGSLKETEFDIRFNPDVYSVGVQHANPEGEQLKKERELVNDAADFIITGQIPAFLRDCIEHTISPIDGSTLAEALHNKGINIRYLGKITDMLGKVVHLEHVYTVAVSELITRAAKHLFTNYMQSVEMMGLSASICHFLNCFLSSCQSIHAPIAADEVCSKHIRSLKKRSRKKHRNSPFMIQDNNEWTFLTPKSFWNNLQQELKEYFDWNLSVDSIDSAVEMYKIHKVSLLRSFCLKTGIQIMLREYVLDSRHKQIFNEDDIINIFPVVKHINPRATDAYHFYTNGQTKIQQGFLKEGYELIIEALNLLNNVYGAMHPEIAQCLRMLARLNYIMGDYGEAMAYQQKAVLMSERVNGIDHPYTITEYTHLALYCFANAQVTTALKLLYRARYLALIVCGENHPEIALLDSNIGLVLHAVGEYDLSLRFLEKALNLNIKFFGIRSLKVAVSYHLVARTQSCMGDFRSALQNEKETYGIYKQQLGEEHEKTKDSSECLRHLTQQAVVLQKKMNEIYTGKVGTSVLPPIQIHPPPMGSVLDMLNVINGILFVQISQQDIDNFKAEIERSQKKEELKDNSIKFSDSIEDSDETSMPSTNIENDVAGR